MLRQPHVGPPTTSQTMEQVQRLRFQLLSFSQVPQAFEKPPSRREIIPGVQLESTGAVQAPDLCHSNLSRMRWQSTWATPGRGSTRRISIFLLQRHKGLYPGGWSGLYQGIDFWGFTAYDLEFQQFKFHCIYGVFEGGAPCFAASP